MSNIAIIAEYNPFHNGHQYLVDYASAVLGADNIISLMSGNFVQRGVPAMADKYTSAEAALSSGISMVFELPVIYATGSARDFAVGAVNILDRLGCIDGLLFGAEDDLPEETPAAEVSAVEQAVEAPAEEPVAEAPVAEETKEVESSVDNAFSSIFGDDDDLPDGNLHLNSAPLRGKRTWTGTPNGPRARTRR